MREVLKKYAGGFEKVCGRFLPGVAVQFLR